MGTELTGIIQQVFEGEGFTVFVPHPETAQISRLKADTVRVVLDDGRSISNAQRRKIFALVGDITDWVCAPGKSKREKAEMECLREMHLLYLIDQLSGDMDDDRARVRRQLTTHYCDVLDIAPFSLSDVDMSTATDFIGWLIDMVVYHGIPCIDSLLNRAEDIGRYLYACVANRRCAVCGARADIHHSRETVGAGQNRRKLHNVGVWVQPLCRKHHSEVEQIGQNTFDQKYAMQDIQLDAHLCKCIGWKE